MFEDLSKTLKGLTSVSIPIEKDKKGFIDKQYLNEAVNSYSKLSMKIGRIYSKTKPFGTLYVDIKLRQISGSRKHKLSIALVRQREFWKIPFIMHWYLVQKNLIGNKVSTRSMKVSGGKKSTYVLPAEAVDEMELEIECESCAAHFSAIGNAFFCPCCGENSATQNYSDAIRKIISKKENIEAIKKH